MGAHTPARWLFTLSLVIAVAAAATAFTSRQFAGRQGLWIALLAYGVLAISNFAHASSSE